MFGSEVALSSVDERMAMQYPSSVYSMSYRCRGMEVVEGKKTEVLPECCWGPNTKQNYSNVTEFQEIGYHTGRWRMNFTIQDRSASSIFWSTSSSVKRCMSFKEEKDVVSDTPALSMWICVVIQVLGPTGTNA
ncbi:hypothetical protein IAQ61_006222 [Plenodomus lingam]|uniref:uncharacterized protein n=1 Tax=Leptosphaeria maculans TaxID=5022 RepID=UPI00331E5E19|nr:hypothetical protein IAQ61_006222 [Plenodomus lingam]